MEKTPIQQIDGTELGRRMAFSQLAMLGVSLLALEAAAPVILSIGALHTDAPWFTFGRGLDRLPWVPISTFVCSIPFVAEITRRIPRRVEVHRIVKGSWKVPIGKTYRGRWVFHDFNRIPHAKVGGLTGTGKTVQLETILAVLTQQQTPNDLQIYIVDLKGGASFAHFERLPHVNGRVYADTAEALKAVTTCHEEMKRRLDVIRAARRDFQKLPHFPRILLCVDEGGELSPAYAHTDAEKELRKQILDRLTSIARIGREPMVSILYGTQRPSNETLPVSIRGQMDATFAFRTRSEGDSGVLMEHKGAEQIPHRAGRMIYQTPDAEVPVQGAYVRDDVLKAWITKYEADDSATKTTANEADDSEGAQHGASGGVALGEWGV